MLDLLFLYAREHQAPSCRGAFEGAVFFVGSPGSRGVTGLLGQHTLTLSRLQVHLSHALLAHYLLICFIWLLVYNPHHPGREFLES